MPNMNGLELVNEIRKEDTNTPLVILSAYDESEYFLESIRLGVDGYLLKPLVLDDMHAVFKKVVKRIQNDKELQAFNDSLHKIIEEKTKELEYRYLHEFYTDLPNTIMLHNDLLSHDFDYMLLLDISHFSVLNKEYGKEFANHVITKTAHILKKHIHKDSKLYKTESDRFTILLKNTTIESVHSYCKQIISFFDVVNIKVDDSQLHITFNIGVDKVRPDVTQTLINCEYALDKSKELGSRHCEIYSDEASKFVDEKEAIKWLHITRELILNDSIEPYFQPIQDINRSKVYKYEALARGMLKGEIVSPYFFIKPAEKLGLSTSITRMMINKSFSFMSSKDFEFSINLTERDLLEGYLIGYLKEKLKQYKITPNRVTFEILENITAVKNSKEITLELNTLRDMGFKIAIDDFGIENSNFSRLLEINLDFIKIDGIFIKGLKENEKNRTIIKAIVNLAQTLNIKTVAEFVEDSEIYDIVEECGIDFAQGYYIGKPKPELLK
jgi:diguanylate cyclase (GGDEF)-like protein